MLRETLEYSTHITKTPTHYPTLSHKWHHFQKKSVTEEKCAFGIRYNCYLKHLILRRNELRIIIYAHMSSCKVPVILIRFE
jgi:hypothetical protein